MKKVIVLSAIVFLFSTKGLSQDNNRKGFTAVNLGISIPTGNFRSDYFENNESGYATTRLIMDFTCGYKIRENIGLIAIYRSQANGVDVGAYAQDLANYFGTGNPAGTTSVTVESNVYSLGGIMAGTYGAFPIADKLSFEPRILIGFSAATLPAMTTETYYRSTLLTTFIREQPATWTFSYNIGTGAKLELSEKICLTLNLDFYAARAEWDNVQEVGIGHMSNTTEIYQFEYRQKFSTFNVSTGLGFRF